MKNKTIIALFAVTLSLGGCAVNGPAYRPPIAQAAAVVDMSFSRFSPQTITIHVGDTVEWRNKVLIAHTVTDDPQLAKKVASSLLPIGVSAFDSGRISSGQIYTHRFTVPGTYRYFCQYHETHGMVGTVVVER